MFTSLSKMISAFPQEWPEDPIPSIRDALASHPKTLMVLDDDPTGCQTVHDVPLLTMASKDILAASFEAQTPCLFLVTNSRGLDEEDAADILGAFSGMIRQAIERTGRAVRILSRSDSTLRSHYPVEVSVLAERLGMERAMHVVMPFFLEGGRYTVEDIHYVADGDVLTPAAETPFARDSVFGYRSSDLRDWVVEKTNGAISKDDVLSISIGDIRMGGPDFVAEKLRTSAASACVVNALSERDMQVAALACLMAEAAGKNLIYQSAASLVRGLAGQYPRDPLTRDELDISENAGGLVVVGSHVPKTTAQLEHLLENTDIHPIHLDVSKLLDEATYDEEILRVAGEADRELQAGRSAVVYTSRRFVEASDNFDDFEVIERISSGIYWTIRDLKTQPGYMVVKGGITACTVAAKSLGMIRMKVLGQIIPGVPVWRAAGCDDDPNLPFKPRWPELPYVVFPGNVGGTDALTAVVRKLSQP